MTSTVTPNGFSLDTSGQRVVVDPICRIEGHLRIGGQVSVVSYSEGSGFLNMLGALYIRLMSWLAYAY